MYVTAAAVVFVTPRQWHTLPPEEHSCAAYGMAAALAAVLNLIDLLLLAAGCCGAPEGVQLREAPG